MTGVAEHIDIAAPATEVWAIISAPGYVAEVHPFCASNPVAVWDGVGARDTIHYYGGRVVERRFVAWYEGEGYDLEVADANGRVAEVSWRLAQVSPESTQLAITIRPRMLDQLPGLIRWAPLLYVRLMLRRYLRSVLRGVAHRVTTGRPVERNQFGSHPWFSPAAG